MSADSKLNTGLIIGSMSAAIIALELLLTRLFSATLFYHFTFVAISVGMLGMSLSAFKCMKEKITAPESEITKAALGFCAGVLLTIATITYLPIISEGPEASAWGISCYYLICLVPFFFGGRVLAIIFTVHAKDFSKLYAIDFLCAVMACVVTIPILRYLGAAGAILLLTIIIPFSIAAALPNQHSKERKICLYLSLAMATIICLESLTGFLTPSNPRFPDKKPVFDRWNAISRITVFEIDPHVSVPPQLYDQNIVSKYLLYIDSWASTPIIPSGAWSKIRDYDLNFDISSAVYHVKPAPEQSLIIGTGGGRDIMVALRHHARKVDAVEINPTIANEVMRRDFLKYSGGIYKHPQVEVHVSDGRHFIERTEHKYDTILLTLVDTFATTAAGAFALSENNLYTVDAVRAYLEHLKEDGILAISRWAGEETLRLIEIFKAAGKQLGIEDSNGHLAVVATTKAGYAAPQSTFVLFKRSPFTKAELARLQNYAKRAKQELFFDPSQTLNTRTERYILGTPNEAEQANLKIQELGASTDNWPFFFFRPIKPYLGYAFQKPSRLFLMPEYTVLGVTIVVAFITILCFFFPLLIRRENFQMSDLKSAPYFLALGLGFIFFEIPWIQRSVLVLGHPALAFSTVIAGLLLGGGCGSFWIHKSKSLPKPMLVALAAVALMTLEEFLHNSIISAIAHEHLLLRISVIVALLLPIGFLIGTLLPLGMNKLAKQKEEMVAWAWALNGSSTVLGSCLAMLSALFGGFSQTIIIGISCYFFAAFASFLLPKQS